jgi:septal ring factor EnvC (AmiA/AmiB activator)
MEVTPIDQWAVGIEVLLGFALTMAGAIWAASKAYAKLMAKLDGLKEEIDAMKDRNLRADRETEAVKAEQALQKTTVAVMSEQIKHIGTTTARIDATVNKVADGMAQLLVARARGEQ